MKKDKGNRIYIIILIFILLSTTVVSFVVQGRIVWHSDVDRYIGKYYGKPVDIKSNIKYSYKGSNYRIVFGTSKGKKDYLFLQCFKEKLNGLIYEPTYGSGQGESTLLYSIIQHYIPAFHDTNESFIVVSGYNKDFKASSFSVKKVSDGKWITQDISKQEYFTYIYTNIECPEIVFRDAQGKDISTFFGGQ